jgi:hypothetical protein
MRALLERALMTLLALLILCYVLDWTVYRYRAAHGTAFSSIKVSQYLATPLKNNKTEFDYTGSQQVNCVRSIFPWAGDDPCWWVQRQADR